MKTETSKPFAFVRVDEILQSSSWLDEFSLFVSLNRQTLQENVFYSAQTLLLEPFARYYQNNDPTKSSKIRYVNLQGMSEDRLYVLAQSYVEKHVRKKITPKQKSWLDSLSKQYQVILLSDHLDVVVSEVAKLWSNIYGVCANILEIKRGTITGRLHSPIIGDIDTITAIGRFARQHGFALSESHFYSSFKKDATLFTLFESATAVNPDRDFVQLCKQMNWNHTEI